MSVNDLDGKALWVRQRLLEMTISAGRGHLASCLSIVDVLVALYYGNIMRFDAHIPKHPERDCLLVSKGHASAALYPILADLGFFDLKELDNFTKPDALLGMFARTDIPGIEAISDSLGHGLGIGCGLAHVFRQQPEVGGRKRTVFVILGDAECNEGSVWEAAMFAAHYRLDNLVAIIDCNGLGILGKPVGQETLASRWSGFGWVCRWVDGHNIEALCSNLGWATSTSTHETFLRPKALLCSTVKGKGISFMEGRPEWHSKSMEEEHQRVARRDLGIVV